MAEHKGATRVTTCYNLFYMCPITLLITRGPPCSHWCFVSWEFVTNNPSETSVVSSLQNNLGQKLSESSTELMTNIYKTNVWNHLWLLHFWVHFLKCAFIVALCCCESSSRHQSQSGIFLLWAAQTHTLLQINIVHWDSWMKTRPGLCLKFSQLPGFLW